MSESVTKKFNFDFPVVDVWANPVGGVSAILPESPFVAIPALFLFLLAISVCFLSAFIASRLLRFPELDPVHTTYWVLCVLIAFSNDVIQSHSYYQYPTSC
jgi:hypothetical protein